MSMSALTVWQPWATLIAELLKPLEFRGWPAPDAMIGRRIGIHAGARPIRRSEMQELLLKLQGPRWRETGLVREGALALIERALATPGSFPLSSMLCTAVLGQPIRDNDLAERLGLPTVNDSDRGEHSSWGWPLTDIVKLEPFLPARGAQGFWQWTQPGD